MCSLPLFAQTTIYPDDYFSSKTTNPTFTTTDGEFTISTSQAEGQNPPIYNLGYNGADNDIRVYAGGVLTIKAENKHIQAIEFTMSEQGLKRWAQLTPSTGQTAVNVSKAITTWTGDATSIDFSVGAGVDFGTESGKAGQFCFKQLIIYVEGDNNIPEIKVDTITLDVNSVLINPEYFETYGDVEIYAYDNQNGLIAMFDIYPDALDNLDGSYSDKNQSIDVYYSSVTIIDANADNGYREEMVMAASLNISTEDNRITLDGSLLTADNNVYIVKYTGNYEIYESDSYQYEPDEVVTLNENFTDIEIYDYTDYYGVVDLALMNDNGFVMLEYVAANLPENDNMPLAVGTYTITDNAQNEGDFIASTGYNGYYDNPSYYGVWSEEGYYDDTYYFVSGSITVAIQNDVYTLSINATTAKGSTFNGVYTYVTNVTSTENIKETIKTDIRYNILGMQVDKHYKGIVIHNSKKHLLK